MNSLIYKLLLGIILAVPATTAAQSGEQIPILAWHGVGEHTLERYIELKESGITHNFTGFSNADMLAAAMDTAHLAGIKMFVACPEMRKEPEKTVARFKNHPALAGYYLQDEPHRNEFAELGRWAERIQSVDMSHHCYLNLYPNYATPALLGTETYREHVQLFIREVPMQMLSFDHYPVYVDADGKRRLRDMWYENLEIFSDEAHKAGKPFWAFALTVAHTGPATYPIPTPAELRLQVYSNLAYGAQGIQYFTYWTPGPDAPGGYYHGPIDSEFRKRTEIWDMIRELNMEIKNLSPVFLNAEVIWTGHTGSTIPQGTSRPGKLPDVIKALDIEGAAVVSLLNKGDDMSLVVVNRSFEDTLPVTVEGMSGLRRVLKDGTKIRWDKYVPRLIVEPGDVLVLTWEK